MEYNKVSVTQLELMRQARSAVNLKALGDQVDAVVELVLRKNADYGDAWQRYGIFTPLIRLNDKLLRLQTLADGRAAMVADESVADTLKDLIGYSLLALAWLDANDLKELFDKANRAVPEPEQWRQLNLDLFHHLMDVTPDDIKSNDTWKLHVIRCTDQLTVIDLNNPDDLLGR